MNGDVPVNPRVANRACRVPGLVLKIEMIFDGGDSRRGVPSTPPTAFHRGEGYKGVVGDRGGRVVEGRVEKWWKLTGPPPASTSTAAFDASMGAFLDEADPAGGKSHGLMVRNVLHVDKSDIMVLESP
jgi:hypothetical protein